MTRVTLHILTHQHSLTSWSARPDGESDREERRGERRRWLRRSSLSSHLAAPPVLLRATTSPLLMVSLPPPLPLPATELAALPHALFIRLRSAELSCLFLALVVSQLSAPFSHALIYTCLHVKPLNHHKCFRECCFIYLQGFFYFSVVAFVFFFKVRLPHNAAQPRMTYSTSASAAIS